MWAAVKISAAKQAAAEKEEKAMTARFLEQMHRRREEHDEAEAKLKQDLTAAVEQARKQAAVDKQTLRTELEKQGRDEAKRLEAEFEAEFESRIRDRI